MTREHDRRMHVLYIIDSVDSSGGAEQSLAALAPQYRNLGIRLDVAYLHERLGLQAELTDAGAGVHSLAGSGGRSGWVRRARSLIASQGPDLVHTTLFESDVSGRLAARLAGTPVVSSLVNTSYGQEHRADPRVSRWKLHAAQVVDAMTARLARRLHAVSVDVADTMARRLRYPRDRIEVIPRGRSAEDLGTRSAARRTKARSELGIPDDRPLLLAVGRHEHQKGFDVLLRALPLIRARHPTAHLLIAGREGNETEMLRQLVRTEALDGSVSLLGTRRDIPDLLCAADVFVLTSRREGFPGAILEAMALETPIVAADIPQVREAVDGACATFTEPESVHALAAAVERVLSEPEAARRAQRARDRFLRSFSTERVASAMLAFYHHALDQSS